MLRISLRVTVSKLRRFLDHGAHKGHESCLLMGLEGVGRSMMPAVVA